MFFNNKIKIINMKCFVRQLRESVNNPDLPVFETMQQFTLDAITASGNVAMTDAQKWALNHFFYQIGAIVNAGIFAKMKFLFMPVICNENQTTALYDYKRKTNIELSWSTIAFSDKGLIGDGGTKTISNVISGLSQSLTSTSFGMLLMNKVSGSSYNNPLMRFTDSNSADVDINLNSHINQSYCGVQNPRKRARIYTENIKGYVASITGVDAIRAKYILPSGEVVPQSDIQTVADVSLINTIDSVSVRFGPYASQGIITFCELLTEDEERMLANAMNTLGSSFV